MAGKYLIRNSEMIPQTITIACGSTADFDDGSGCAYRCNTCGAVIGSIAMPSACRQLEDDAEIARQSWKILGGTNYEQDYNTN